MAGLPTPGADKNLSSGHLAPRWAPLALAVIGLVLAGTWILWTGPVTPFSDYERYRMLGQFLIDRHQYGFPEPSAHRLPGFPFFLAGLMLISRNFLWLNLANVALFVALVLVVYQLVAHLTANWKLAFIAGFLCAVNPTFVFFSPVLASEHLFVLLLFAAVLVLLVRRGRFWQRGIAAGLLMGAAILTRGEGTFYLPLLLGAAVASAPHRHGRWIQPSVLVVSAALLITPWYVRNTLKVGPGAGLSTTSGLNLYYAHNPYQYGVHKLPGYPFDGMSEIERNKTASRFARDHLHREWRTVPNDIRRGTARLLTEPALYAVRDCLILPGASTTMPSMPRRNYPWGVRKLVEYFYIGLASIAVLSLVWIRKRYRWVFLIAGGVVILNWVCYAVVFWGMARYRFTAEVALCMLAAVPLYEVGRRVLDRRRTTSEAVISK